MQPPEKFATGILASLQSGYALLAQGQDTGILTINPAEIPLIESETVFKQTRPPLSAMKNAAFYESMNEKGAKLFSLFEKKSGVFLMIIDSEFNYDVKFDWENLQAWEITKLNGGTGIPAGV